MNVGLADSKRCSGSAYPRHRVALYNSGGMPSPRCADDSGLVHSGGPTTSTSVDAAVGGRGGARLSVGEAADSQPPCRRHHGPSPPSGPVGSAVNRASQGEAMDHEGSSSRIDSPHPPLLPSTPAPAARARLRRERPLAPRAPAGDAADSLAVAQLRRAGTEDGGERYAEVELEASIGCAEEVYGNARRAAPSIDIGCGVEDDINEANGGGWPKRRRLRGKQPAGCSAGRGRGSSQVERCGPAELVDHGPLHEAEHGGVAQSQLCGGDAVLDVGGHALDPGARNPQCHQPATGPEDGKCATVPSAPAGTSTERSGSHRLQTVGVHGNCGPNPNSSVNSESGGPSRFFTDTLTLEFSLVLHHRDGHELDARPGSGGATWLSWGGRPPDSRGGAA